jgi:uncharacterized protein (TIGR02996 family)
MDHAGFLAAVSAAPGDPAPRLIYADWLDDVGDPRAQLIRLEEQMRTLAVFDDAYWRLKGQRDPLRAAAEPGWLSVFGYDLPRPVFADGWPDDWKGRWRLLRQFAENWHGVVMGDVGRPTGEVLALERQIGREMPPSLREYVAFFGNVSAGRYQVLDGMAIEVVPLADHPSLTLGVMDERTFAVRYADFENPDPPMIYRRLAPGGHVDGEVLDVSVSDFSYDDHLGGNSAEHDMLDVGLEEQSAIDAASEWFGDGLRINDRVIGERPGVYATLLISDQGYAVIRLAASPQLPAEAIPDWAWNLCNSDGWFTGRFLERHQEWRAQNPLAEDDIPF